MIGCCFLGGWGCAFVLSIDRSIDVSDCGRILDSCSSFSIESTKRTYPKAFKSMRNVPQRSTSPPAICRWSDTGGNNRADIVLNI
ncbi:hypothetical protein F2P81_020461 [Scophthalmus maximus]|uniref:Secreted protein n=1 Tax=Scophthalmus maximus TaxID=52904 RepID=A0A6A4S825_SCOMX|nr:hypothetical protein F2P81_020461 [Scophthalmus maximus]